MDCSWNLLALAELLERAYRLALVVENDLLPDACASRQAATELVDLLDEARVSLLKASRTNPSLGRDMFHGCPPWG